MKRISTYIVTLVLALAGSSCSDYLDKEYDASLSEKKVFNNQNLTREFLANIYTNLPDGLAPLSDDQFTGASRDCMTDNAVTCWGLHYYTKDRQRRIHRRRPSPAGLLEHRLIRDSEM